MVIDYHCLKALYHTVAGAGEHLSGTKELEFRRRMADVDYQG